MFGWQRPIKYYFEMDHNNLNEFRKDWISEIDKKIQDSPNRDSNVVPIDKGMPDNGECDRRRRPVETFRASKCYGDSQGHTFTDERDNACSSKGDDRLDSFVEAPTGKCNRRQKRFSNGSQKSCQQEKLRKKNSLDYVTEPFKLKSHTENDLSCHIPKEKAHNKEEEENFLEILIADIDELVSLPFFDLELPREIAINIFKYLNIKDLSHCSCVNSKWKVLADDDLIWYHMCKRYGYVEDELCALDKEGWKQIFQDHFQNERNFKQNWKQRICQISELEYEKGGILYAASVFKGKVIAGYANGLIKLWDIFQESPTASFGCLLSETDSDRDIDSSINCITMNNLICAAGFNNGDMRIWQNGLDFPLIESLNVESRVNCICTSPQSPSIISASGNMFRIDAADENGKWNNIFKKTLGKHIQSVYLYDGNDFPAVIHTLNCVELYGKDGLKHEFERPISAEVSSVHCEDDAVIVGISPLDFSILDGYRIKMMSSQNGHITHLMKGPHCKISCLSRASQDQNLLAVGLTDRTIRTHDSRMEKPVLALKGLAASPCSLQIDDWKVISGDSKGFISVWDQRFHSMLWQTSMRHPVRICKLVGSCLVCVSLPTDRNPKETFWYADDLIQHRRHRGNIRIFDFSVENNTTGIPEICQSKYDAYTGYNYNINLSTPYDDICNF